MITYVSKWDVKLMFYYSKSASIPYTPEKKTLQSKFNRHQRAHKVFDGLSIKGQRASLQFKMVLCLKRLCHKSKDSSPLASVSDVCLHSEDALEI